MVYFQCRVRPIPDGAGEPTQLGRIAHGCVGHSLSPSPSANPVGAVREVGSGTAAGVPSKVRSLEVSDLFSEFNVRAEVSRIETLDVSPMRKARMLLSIAKRARSAARRLVLLSQHHFTIGDPLCGARFREAAHRLCGVYEEVRGRAGTVLGSVPQPVGYGFTDQGNAYPVWHPTPGTLTGGSR